MFTSLRWKLLAGYIALTILPLSLLGLFLLQALDRFYLDRLEQDMTDESGLIASALSPDLEAGRTVEAEQLLNNPPPPLKTQARALVFDRFGVLSGATQPADLMLIGRPLQEPGLAAALSGVPSTGVERSPRLGMTEAYAAAPVVSSSGKVVGAVHLSYPLEQIVQATRDLRLLVLAGILATAALDLLVGLRLAESITGPIATLSAGTEAVAGGDYSRRVPVRGRDEVSRLARNFNRMAAELARDRTERQAMLANIAHDVRTPLGAVHAAAEALQAGAAEDPQLRDRLLAGIADHAVRVGRLAEDLLHLATYQSGGLKLHLAPIEVKPLLGQLALMIQPRAEQQSVCVAIDVPDNLSPAAADPDRLLEALMNLTDNALKFTPAGGRITLSAGRETGGYIWLSVADTGPGLPAELLDHLFERFYRLEPRARSGLPGVGIGLAIVREIALAHGGRVAAANRPEGGTAITIFLPATEGG